MGIGLLTWHSEKKGPHLWKFVDRNCSVSLMNFLLLCMYGISEWSMKSKVFSRLEVYNDLTQYWLLKDRISCAFRILIQRGCCSQCFFTWAQSSHTCVLLAFAVPNFITFEIPIRRVCCIQWCFSYFPRSKPNTSFSIRSIAEFHVHRFVMLNKPDFCFPVTKIVTSLTW